MRSSRKKFVLVFLAVGYAFHFVTRFVLNQAPEALGASPDQELWQRRASTILSPIKAVLVGPINWLQQDPDPPPPFRLILFAVYWSVLALGIHRLLWRKKAHA
ncbi:MAG TPA: hypothetical protein VNG33_19530 [Polyangiaceae bacterium]|nr:hypothetical protein [Polyangiaceae bacterium]